MPFNEIQHPRKSFENNSHDSSSRYDTQQQDTEQCRGATRERVVGEPKKGTGQVTLTLFYFRTFQAMKRLKTGGRQVGSTNKVTRPLKELITDVLTNELNEMLTQGQSMSFDEREQRARVVYMLGRLILKPQPETDTTSQPIIYIHSDL